MEFTEAINSFNSLIRPSPFGKWIAAFQNENGTNFSFRISVYSSRNGSLYRTFTLPSIETKKAAITFNKCDLQWSPDEQKILFCCFKRCKIWCFELEGDNESICSICENPNLGIDRVFWGPNSLTVLTILEHRVN